MRDYELMCILNPDLEESKIEDIINRLQEIINNNGGELQGTDRWGKRRLAYPIKKFHDGYYIVMNFKGNGALLKELDRIIKLTEESLRHMIIRRD